MPYYSNNHHYHLCKHIDFDTRFKPEDRVQRTGIYACRRCLWEIVVREGEDFPPEVECVKHMYALQRPINPKISEVEWILVAAPIQDD